jgi:tetratricopeptide (TPR) repeat protein
VELFERALQIRESRPPDEWSALAALYTQLAGAYRCLKRYADAEPHSRRAVGLYEANVEPGHQDIAISSHNLALIYLELGRLAEAQALSEKALGIVEALHGPDHPLDAIIVYALARNRWKQALFAEADELYTRAAVIFRKHYGDGHARLTTVLEQQAECRREWGALSLELRTGG